METLDNISIHDLLQIGGGGFQGFGEFTPIEPSEDGNTTIVSRAELQAQLEEPSVVADTLENEDSEDIENILDSLGGDISAHIWMIL